MIRAPWAWGCETGNAATTIAVLDFFFHSENQLQTNRAYTNVRDLIAIIGGKPVTWHGDATSEIIAARGNDSSGMTGIMWQAALRQYDIDELVIDPVTGQPRYKGGAPRPSQKSIRDALVNAARAGARAVNLSAEVRFSTRVPITAKDSALANSYAATLAEGMKRTEQLGLSLPLLVIAAGNSHVQARDAGFPLIVNHRRYGRYAIVTGAAAFGVSSAVNPDPDSNYGPLVSIFAPGHKVFGIDPSNNDQLLSGTSFAAPMATGVAGLLFSSDPALDAPTVKQLIITGAQNGGRVALDGHGGSYPLLDAYEALKASSARPGAPLCGNRIWNRGNDQIIVERGNSTEAIITDRDSSDYAAYVNPYHGGKRIDLGFSYQYDWDASARHFVTVPYTNAPLSEVSGAWLSYTYVADHDNVIWADRKDTLDTSGQVSRLRLLSTRNGSVVMDLSSQHLPGTSRRPGTLACIVEYPVDIGGTAAPFVATSEFSGSYQCAGYGPVGAWNSAPTTTPEGGEPKDTPVLGSVAPQGDAVFLPVNIRRLDVEWSDLFVGGCNSHDTDPQYAEYTVRRCALKTVDLDSAVSAMVYRVDTATKQWTPIPLLPDGSTARASREINSLEVSEDGKEIMISTTQRANHSDYDGASACHDETLEWISIDRSSTPRYPPGTVIRRVPVPQGTSCGGWVEAGGTVSPSRLPNGDNPTLEALRTRPGRRPLVRAPNRRTNMTR